MKIDNVQLANWFRHHPAKSPETVEDYKTIRLAGLSLATLIVQKCPPCADTTAAVRKVREAVMTANAAIACEPTRSDSSAAPTRPDPAGSAGT